MRQFLTTGELASLLRVSESTVINWAKSNRIKSLRVGRRWLFDQSALTAMLDELAA
jgi:excisionase family DNA binding protein